jgi:mono/diheme cytochrome c family protein
MVQQFLGEPTTMLSSCRRAGMPHLLLGRFPHRSEKLMSTVKAFFKFALSVLFVSATACPTHATDVDFNRQIRPILTEFCFSCHGPDANQRKADLRLDLEHEAKKSSIVSRSSNESELIHRIRSQDEESIMPPPTSGKVLSKAQIALLSQWIDEGAKYSDHWAFSPIGQSSQLLNALKQNDATTEAPIDQFLLHKLSAVGLSYSKEISRNQFIRRATFDLTGLPPTWDEVVAFEKDDAEGHIGRLIDRLLDSPRYGERWGRQWLDIARYADTHGGAAIGFTTFPFSYTYRDYVIGAFNRNLPFDRFILEQIAADQLGLTEDDPSLAALGFLTVGMQFRNFHDSIDDQIDVITRGLMGLTVSCARCHDHKFDAIPTTDYYSLYAAIVPSKAPAQLPVIGSVPDIEASKKYETELKDLNAKLSHFVRDQSDVLRGRLRMQVGLYLAEIAKGKSEQDLSTEFLSYRTDDLRPLIFNRWRDYLKGLTKTEPVFGPWIEMQAWGTISSEEFAKQRDAYLLQLSTELDTAGRTPDKVDALRGEPPKWNPLVVDALVDSKPISLNEVAVTYGKVFAEQQRLWLKSLLETANEASSEGTIVPDDHPQHLVVNSPSHRQLRSHLYAPGTPFDISNEVAMGLANRTISDLISGKSGAIHQLNLTAPGSPPRAMSLREDPEPKDNFVFIRGNPLSRGARVFPKFIAVLSDSKTSTFENGKRRLGLARSVVSNNNPMTSRVVVNWAWQNHFGYGLVRTPDDFGTRGQPPTHPELLDYLADELRKKGWSLKWLHRQIMLSQAYRQGAMENDHSRQKDPENHLLWRMPRRRLDFESMRDAMLAVCDELDVTMGGRPIDLNASPAIPRRSVYGFVNRDVIANLMSTFDSANPNACTAKRPETTVPQQTLFALNSDFIQDRAIRLASIAKQATFPTNDERIVSMVRRILGRTPATSEVERARGFIESDSIGSKEESSTADPERKWIQLAHALMASNEFFFLD